jgi:hypothetical protein
VPLLPQLGPLQKNVKQPNRGNKKTQVLLSGKLITYFGPLYAIKLAGSNVGTDLLANDNLKDKTVVKDSDSDSSNEVDKDLGENPRCGLVD